MSHYYEKSGDKIIPQHYVPMATDPNRMRGTTIRDVKKWIKEGRKVVPSVTTILNVLDKPALVNWKVDQHIQTCYEMEFDKDVEFDSFKQDIKTETEQRLSLAPKAGTNFHNIMESYLKGIEVPPEFFRICVDVEEKIVSHCGDENFNTEVTIFNDIDNYAGQVDLSVGNDDEWVIDYKTKQFTDKFKPKRMAYPDHSRQLAAYRQWINPKARCANVFVCLEDGQVEFHEHKEADLELGWAVFHHSLQIWRLSNGF